MRGISFSRTHNNNRIKTYSKRYKINRNNNNLNNLIILLIKHLIHNLSLKKVAKMFKHKLLIMNCLTLAEKYYFIIRYSRFFNYWLDSLFIRHKIRFSKFMKDNNGKKNFNCSKEKEKLN